MRTCSLDLSKLLYCDRITWPLMDLEVLRYWNVACLLDPETGDGLVLDPAMLLPLNRAARRARKAHARI